MVQQDAPPTRRRRLSATDRRVEILRAASDLFGAHGYAQVSMQRVATAAGISNPVVYDHFASKRDLYTELLEDGARLLAAATPEPEPGESPADALARSLAWFISFIEAEPGVWRMLFRDRPADAEIGTLHDRIRAEAGNRLATAVLAPAGALPHPPRVSRAAADDLAAALCLSALDGLAGWRWTHPRIDAAAAAEATLALLQPFEEGR